MSDTGLPLTQETTNDLPRSSPPPEPEQAKDERIDFSVPGPAPPEVSQTSLSTSSEAHSAGWSTDPCGQYDLLTRANKDNEADHAELESAPLGPSLASANHTSSLTPID